LSQFGRNLLGRKGQQGGEGHNGDEVETKDGDGVHVESAGDNADGHKDEEDVDIVAAEGGPDGARNVLGHGLPFGFIGIGAVGEQRRLLVVVGAVQDSTIAAVGRHIARIGVVWTASCTIKLSPYVFYVPRRKQLAKNVAEGAQRGRLLSRWLRLAEEWKGGEMDAGVVVQRV
jgi:hypothetical protein